MKRGMVQIGMWLAVMGVCSNLSAATDPFLQLSSPILTNGQVQFTLMGESGVSYVIEFSTDANSWSPVVTNSDASITRTIVVQALDEPAFYHAWRPPLPVFGDALVTKLNIKLLGNNVHFDSFDSGDILYSTSGNYDPAKAKSGGNLASGYGFVEVGNASINGRIKTGPNGSYSFLPNGYAGPIGWEGPGLFSPEWYQNDFRFALPDVSPLYDDGLPPVSLVSGTNYWILDATNYFATSNVNLLNKVVLVIGDAQLYATGSFIMRGGSELKINPGASLKLFVAGTNAEVANVTNPNGASAFQLYGLTLNTSVIWSGNNDYIGTIHAPNATVSFGGGGSNVYSLHGACVARQVTVNGHVKFHFDENLKRIGPKR